MRDSPRPSSRRAVALAVSVAAHLVVLLALFRSVVWRFSTPPQSTPIELALVASPIVTTTGRAAAVPTPASTRRLAPSSRKPGSASPANASATTFKAAGPAITLSSGEGAGPGDAGTDLRGALRAALGCSSTLGLHLTDDERRRCERQSAETVKSAARVDGLPPEKRRYYDAVVQAYAFRQDPALIDPTAHSIVLGCSIPFGVPRGWKPSRERPPHALRLGPCFIGPPKGFLTEEADLPSPVDLKQDEP